MATTTDVFGRGTPEIGTPISAEKTRMTFSGLSQAAGGLLLQQVQVSYTQQITRLYTLEDNRVYFVAGRQQGQMGAAHVIGPAGVVGSFYSQYGNVCNAGGNFTLLGSAGCDINNTTLIITLERPIIQSLEFRVQVEDMLIGTSFQAQFLAMTLNDA